jgi:DNA-binding NarL/FixJ family response regulator
MNFLVVDDHAVVRQGVAAVLRGLEPQATVLEAPNCAAALSLATAHPDIALVLMDLMMPDASGLSAVETFLAASPATPLMVISSSEAPSDVRAALALGALGYVAKTANASTLTAAIRLVLNGEIYVPPFMVLADAPTAGRGPGDTLTERQQAVLALIREGVSNKVIAHRLGVTEATVKAHLTAIFRALGVSNRAEAARHVQP